MPDLTFSLLVLVCPYIAVTAAVAFFVYLQAGQRAAWKLSIEAADERAQQAASRLDSAEASITRIQAQVSELEDNIQLLSGAPAQSWTNINRRTQALRMIRGGDKSSRIAAELSMSRGEVELIRRVHDLTVTGYDQPAGATKNSDEHSSFWDYRLK
jgi:TolA-binding protein